ncbi:heavy metal translocating P-type ATPase [Lacunimicrobium album]
MSEKTHLDIQLILPAIPDSYDACVDRLGALLEAKNGIESVHLLKKEHKGTGQICIHYDPKLISIGEVRELALRVGAELERRYGHFLVRAEPMHARQARTLESRIRTLEGVLEAGVSPAGVIRIEFDLQVVEKKQILTELERIGWRKPERLNKDRIFQNSNTHDAEEKVDDEHQHGWLGEMTELIFAGICGALLLFGWTLSMASSAEPTLWIVYLTAYVFGGFFTFREAFENIRAYRLEIDLLMLVAAVGAATLGAWAEGALLLFLFSLGHSLEHYAMGRAKRAIEALGELTPQTATVRREGRTEEVPVEQLRKDDVTIVKPNERIPADGFVVKGESSVNQAPITGESVPVDKKAVENATQVSSKPEKLGPEYRVFAGTINGSGVLEIQVTKISSESTLARIVQMVSEVETQKSPTQRFTDRFERYFVPAILIFVVLLLFAGTVVDEPFRNSFYRAMAVLVAASPCALAISTPSAVLSGVARAARGGVLVKGGRPLENLGRLSAIAFDKTGTLTEGKPRLTDIEPAEGIEVDYLLRVAIAVEKLSDHPLAAALVKGGQERLKEDSNLQAHDVQSITGRGVKATIDGDTVYIGKDSLFSEVEGAPLPDSLRAKVESLKSNGRTTMVVRAGTNYLGVLGLMDTPRSAAKEVVSQLRTMGIKRMIMLSGDNPQVAKAVAEQVGIDEALGDLMPDDKVNAIKKLNSEDGVAMVGDGVNDAPAMASATVGIAMGAAGSDVALETADVALMADDLKKLPFAVGLSRQTSRIIRQNLWFSLGMVAFLVPATVLGLQMGAAVMFHEGSTLIVVFNALRLLKYQGS